MKYEVTRQDFTMNFEKSLVIELKIYFIDEIQLIFLHFMLKFNNVYKIK